MSWLMLFCKQSAYMIHLFFENSVSASRERFDLLQRCWMTVLIRFWRGWTCHNTEKRAERLSLPSCLWPKYNWHSRQASCDRSTFLVPSAKSPTQCSSGGTPRTPEVPPPDQKRLYPLWLQPLELEPQPQRAILRFCHKERHNPR